MYNDIQTITILRTVDRISLDHQPRKEDWWKNQSATDRSHSWIGKEDLWNIAAITMAWCAPEKRKINLY